MTVDGIKVTKPGNIIKDAIPGVTLTLLKPSNSTISVDVARDVATVKASVEDFVKNYNKYCKDKV